MKRGPFKTAYLGQLNGYLTVLDDYVRKSHENPSIGLVLCKSADKSIVEYLIKDYNKPMGVATYRAKEEMPEKFRDALPDIEELKKLLWCISPISISGNPLLKFENAALM